MKNKTQKEIEELKIGWQRTQADFDNYKKRTERERQKWQEDSKLEVFTKLLPLLDNIFLAQKHVPNAIADDSWVQGILYIGRQIDNELQELQIERVAVKVGDAFDHNLHEAIESRPDKSLKDNQIIEIRNEGYKIGDRLIRPARVVVCKNG